MSPDEALDRLRRGGLVDHAHGGVELRHDQRRGAREPCCEQKQKGRNERTRRRNPSSKRPGEDERCHEDDAGEPLIGYESSR